MEQPIMAKAGHENFSVALRVLPAPIRTHLLAIYGAARLIDDAGDEAGGDRLGVLDAIEHDLDRAYRGTAIYPTFQRLTPTARALDLPREPFTQLIEANRRDQRVRRYPTYPDLLDYCALSANPIGRLVLHVFGAATPERFAFSDAICTALQIIEHCQDVTEDRRRGRIYLPLADLDRFACAERDLDVVPAPACVREVIAFQIERVRGLLQAGTPLLRSLHGWGRLAVAGYVAGGYAAAAAIARADFNVSASAPRGRRSERLRRTAALVWAARRPRMG